jgi:hypothetical protein
MTILTLGDHLVADLEELRVALKSLSDRLNESGIERTHHLREIMGEECRYYKKSMALFEEKDYENLRDLVRRANQCFDLIEGKK